MNFHEGYWVTVEMHKAIRQMNVLVCEAMAGDVRTYVEVDVVMDIYATASSCLVQPVPVVRSTVLSPGRFDSALTRRNVKTRDLWQWSLSLNMHARRREAPNK